METAILLYILKVNIALSIIYGLYYVFLRKDTFFTLKRFYFLSGIFISLLYPFLSLRFVGDYSPGEAVQTFIYQIALDPVDINGAGYGNTLEWRQISLLVGAVISGILILRLIIQCISIAHIILEYKRINFILNSKIVYIHDKELNPFSFFKWIFINPSLHSIDDLNEIVIHEKVHAKQYHSVDVLVCEILSALFWWNPLIWLLKKDIRMNLEYIADNAVLTGGTDAKKYQYHLVKLSYGKTAIVVNNFNVSQLKKRILMMNKERTIKTKLTKYLIILPAFGMLIAANTIFTACSEKQDLLQGEPETQKVTIQVTDTQTEESEPKNITVEVSDVHEKAEVMPEFAGGTNALMKYIFENLKYPVAAVDQQVEGRVIARFVISKTGKVKDVEILRSLSPECDAEALRVIKSMPDWKPGKEKGEPVEVFYTMPILFKLQ